MVRQETWTYSTCFGKCSIHLAYSISTYDVLRFDSAKLLMYLSIYHPQG